MSVKVRPVTEATCRHSSSSRHLLRASEDRGLEGEQGGSEGGREREDRQGRKETGGRKEPGGRKGREGTEGETGDWRGDRGQEGRKGT